MKELTILLGGGEHEHDYCETWTVNDTYRRAHRIDKHFMFHKQIYYIVNNEPVFNWEAMNKLGCEIITLREIEDIKRQTLYPLNEITQRFKTTFLGHSGAYLLAYACYLSLSEPYDIIYLDGWTFASQGENSATDGRFIEFWIGLAKGLGIDIWLPRYSWLCRTWHDVPYALAYETQV